MDGSAILQRTLVRLDLRVTFPNAGPAQCAPLRHHGQARGPDPQRDLGCDALRRHRAEPVLVRSEEQPIRVRFVRTTTPGPVYLVTLNLIRLPLQRG